MRGNQIRPLPDVLLPQAGELVSGFPEDEEATLIKSILATRGSRRGPFHLNYSRQGASSGLSQEIFLSRDLPVSNSTRCGPSGLVLEQERGLGRACCAGIGEGLWRGCGPGRPLLTLPS